MESAVDDLRLRKIKKSERGIILEEDHSFSTKQDDKLLPTFTGFFLFFFYVFSVYLFKLYENALPDQLSIKDSAKYPDRFIGERAQLHLKGLTQLGPRVVGSYENEILAVDFLKREISFIAQQANSMHNIEINVQKATGSYFFVLNHYGLRNCYANIQNVVVKLSSGNSTKSVLLNCHYDTVPESPGASDNGLNCAVMLEILRVLSSQSTPLKNSVIFLFNGAEENPLQGSHGFLSQHKWKDEVKVVINLDSAGSGGKEVMFQTSGENWLIKSFVKSVPRPSAGVHGEELFHYGLIPSDTDFRIFRDFGKYPGFDIAHCTNGYVYHTKFDSMDFIKPGVYQHTGDNILALVKELINLPNLGETHGQVRVVYFDVFGFFVVTYSEYFGIIINLLTVALSLFATFKTVNFFSSSGFSLKEVLLCCLGQVCSLIASIVVVYLISKFLDMCKSTLSWYLCPWLIIPIYAIPVMLCWTVVLLIFQSLMKKDLAWNKSVKLMNGAYLFLSFLLLLATLKGIRSSFILMSILLFSSLGTVGLIYSKNSFTVKEYISVHFISLFFPLLFVNQQTARVFIILIPMAARMGPQTNPEMIMGLLTVILTTPYLTQVIPLVLMLKKLRSFLLFFTFVFIFTMIGVIFTKQGFPYDENSKTPVLQRFYVFHNQRTFHNREGGVRKSDSGFYVQSMDRNNFEYLLPFIPELDGAKTCADDCSTEIFCGFPAFTSRFLKPASFARWIPSEPPYINKPALMEVVSQTQVSQNTRRIKFRISGPDHITIGISPKHGIDVVRWSFDLVRPVFKTKDNERKTYFIYFSYGMESTLEFDADFRGIKNPSDAVLDIAIVGHYMHEKKSWSRQFKDFLSRFPKWAHLTPWITTYKSWTI